MINIEQFFNIVYELLFILTTIILIYDTLLSLVHEPRVNIIVIFDTLFLFDHDRLPINIIETINIDTLFLFNHDRLPINIKETIILFLFIHERSLINIIEISKIRETIKLFLFIHERSLIIDMLFLFDHDDRLSNSNIDMLLLLVHDDRFINNIVKLIDMLFLLVHDGILFLLAHDDSLIYFNSVIVREMMFKNRFVFRTFTTFNGRSTILI